MDSVVETRQGRLQGRHEAGVHVFRGVPFAQEPVGPLRFAPPRPARPWTGVRPAREFAAVSHQSVIGLGFMGAGQQRQSEDCLYLNVWTPAADGGKRPVMVWIHGGGFTGGSGSSAWYSGANLARRGDVVAVTVNYRLGALGFLWYKARAFGDGARKLRPARPGRRAPVGPRRDRGVRRRPGERDHLRRIGGIIQRHDADGDATGCRAVRPGDRRERHAVGRDDSRGTRKC